MSEAPVESRIRVLVVDDDVVHLRLMTTILEDGCEVSTARDGEQALARIERGELDVVCSDYKMPRMNGLELFRRLSARSSDVGFVLVTGMKESLETIAEQPDGGQFHTVLVKPYEPEQLIEAVTRAARFAQMRRAVGAATSSSKRLKRTSV